MNITLQFNPDDAADLAALRRLTDALSPQPEHTLTVEHFDEPIPYVITTPAENEDVTLTEEGANCAICGTFSDTFAEHLAHECVPLDEADPLPAEEEVSVSRETENADVTVTEEHTHVTTETIPVTDRQITFIDLRGFATSLLTRGGKETLRGILGERGVTKLSDLPESTWDAVAAEITRAIEETAR